ncbi:FYVE-type zinc finger-containing protein [Escovopsis weberi]|uniref:FYVE-type zinc finger-containing protein n=1 Tax=Escovopsis weberi TaxID=150374 RepID=A0A0M9VT89_ESCWE|nr:FYVE-type zinc finger-containing protein [Escovopsis weberi]
MTAELIMHTLPGHQQETSHFFPRRPQHTRARSQTNPGPQLSPNSHLNYTYNYNLSENQHQQVQHPFSIYHAQHSQQTVSSPPSPTSSYPPRISARPLYMPAALRPNDEFPSRPLVKPKTNDSSSDSGSEYGTLRRYNTLMGITGLGNIGQRLNRRPAESQPKTFEGEWNLDQYPEVTEQPTRKHWKPDVESSVCDDPTCKRTFSYFIRRHHCRKCGYIFCDLHSSFTLPLDQDANFNPRAVPSRTCNHCFEQFKVWHSREGSQSSNSSSAKGPITMPSTPLMAPNGTPFNLPTGPEVPNSVPRDWNWSTF